MQAKTKVNPRDVAVRLEVARKARGVAKQAVAKAAGMTPSNYTQWITASTVTYDAEKMYLTARFLGVRMAWLLFGELPMNINPQAAAAAALVEDAPPEVVNETLNFMSYQLNRSMADDPVTLGNYLKMIDSIMRRPKE
jgi:transcriptional regulator with XRE-family HTH domain